jgi:hypothetical protein
MVRNGPLNESKESSLSADYADDTDKEKKEHVLSSGLICVICVICGSNPFLLPQTRRYGARRYLVCQ